MPLREKQRAQRKLEKRSSNKVSSTGFLPNRAKVFIESSVAIYHEEYNFPLHLLPAPESQASSIRFSIPAVIRNTLGYRWSEAELILEPCFCDHVPKRQMWECLLDSVASCTPPSTAKGKNLRAILSLA